MNRIASHRVRDEARGLLRKMIVSGELGPDARIEEIKLSEQFGVSRTPVREALIALEEEGLVTSRPRKGFVVVRPDETLVRETYAVLCALEAMAVRLAGERLRAEARKLREINAALARARSKSRQYDLDRAFHVALTEPCGNIRLLRLLTMERSRAQLFDGHHARGMANLQGSCLKHEAIIAALERGAADAAANLLIEHWTTGTEVVLLWLRQRR